MSEFKLEIATVGVNADCIFLTISRLRVSYKKHRLEGNNIPAGYIVRYDTITIFTCTQKLTNSQLNLPHGTKENKKRNEETKKQNTDMLRRKGPVIKSLESILRPEESLWWERFAKEVQ